MNYRGAPNPAHQTQARAWAPFNFAPLHGGVYSPGWGGAVTHDRPFADGYCGYLDIRVTAVTPLLVGGGDEARSSASPPVIRAVRDPEGRPFLPGSSLKGLIRNVVEIASFARFGQFVDDRRLGVRDLTKGGKFYTGKITKNLGQGSQQAFTPLVNAGWLVFDGEDKRWKIRPCRYARVEQSEIIRAGFVKSVAIEIGGAKHSITIEGATIHGKPYNVTPQEKHKCAVAGGKGLVCHFDSATLPQVQIHPRDNGDLLLRYAKISRLMTPHEAQGRKDVKQGHLVFTGQVGKLGKAGRKHMEFVFHTPAARDVALDPRVFADFVGVHSDGRADEGEKPWVWWRNRLLKGEIGPQAQGAYSLPGIPVFYLSTKADGSDVTKLGLAQMFKLAYDFSTHDMARHTSAAHAPEGEPPLDLAEAMFGTVRKDGALSLKGRVSFGRGVFQGDPRQADDNVQRPLVLNGPKPSFYPFYVAQKIQAPNAEAGDKVAHAYATYMHAGDPAPQLRGWKRYLPRRTVNPNPQAGADQNKVAVKLHPLKAGVEFRARINLHNLVPEEIGALVFALQYGDVAQNGRLHGLGLGKPYGFGAVKIEIEAAGLTPNRIEAGAPQTIAGEEARKLIDAHVGAFMSEMARFLGDGGGKAQTYLANPTVKALLTLGDPDHATTKKLVGPAGRDAYVRLTMTENHFKDIKESYLALPQPFGASAKAHSGALAPPSVAPAWLMVAAPAPAAAPRAPAGQGTAGRAAAQPLPDNPASVVFRRTERVFLDEGGARVQVTTLGEVTRRMLDDPNARVSVIGGPDGPQSVHPGKLSR